MYEFIGIKSTNSKATEMGRNGIKQYKNSRVFVIRDITIDNIKLIARIQFVKSH